MNRHYLREQDFEADPGDDRDEFSEFENHEGRRLVFIICLIIMLSMGYALYRLFKNLVS